MQMPYQLTEHRLLEEGATCGLRDRSERQAMFDNTDLGSLSELPESELPESELPLPH